MYTVVNKSQKVVMRQRGLSRIVNYEEVIRNIWLGATRFVCEKVPWL